MQVLIVESNPGLARLWRLHIERQGACVETVADQDAAIGHLQREAVDVIVLNLLLEGGSAFAVADFASYRQPRASVVFVTSSTFFSDGSIFNHIPNARAFVEAQTPPEDLAAIVAYCAA